SDPRQATRPAAPAAGGTGGVSSSRNKGAGLRDGNLSRHRDAEGPPVRLRADDAGADLGLLSAGPGGRRDGAELEPRANPANDRVGRPHRAPGGSLFQASAGQPNGATCSQRRAPGPGRRTVVVVLNRGDPMKVGRRILAGLTLLLSAVMLFVSLAGGVG